MDSERQEKTVFLHLSEKCDINCTELDKMAVLSSFHMIQVAFFLQQSLKNSCHYAEIYLKRYIPK